jgi:hypothetical protein
MLIPPYRVGLRNRNVQCFIRHVCFKTSKLPEAAKFVSCVREVSGSNPYWHSGSL